MELALFYLIFAGAVGFIASQRGRSGAGWFVLAIVISPIIAVIVLALIPPRNAPARSLQDQVRDQLLERGVRPTSRNASPLLLTPSSMT
jgi:hypothetical protein